MTDTLEITLPQPLRPATKTAAGLLTALAACAENWGFPHNPQHIGPAGEFLDYFVLFMFDIGYLVKNIWPGLSGYPRRISITR